MGQPVGAYLPCSQPMLIPNTSYGSWTEPGVSSEDHQEWSLITELRISPEHTWLCPLYGTSTLGGNLRESLEGELDSSGRPVSETRMPTSREAQRTSHGVAEEAPGTWLRVWVAGTDKGQTSHTQPSSHLPSSLSQGPVLFLRAQLPISPIVHWCYAFHSQILLQELPSQWLGMRLEPLCPGVQTSLPALWHRRQPGLNPAGGIHTGGGDASQNLLPHGPGSPRCSLRLAGREPERCGLHHAPTPAARDLPHESPRLVLQPQRDCGVPDHIHRVHRRGCLSLLGCPRLSPLQPCNCPSWIRCSIRFPGLCWGHAEGSLLLWVRRLGKV